MQEVVGEEGLTKIKDSHEKVMVMYYAPWCPHCQDAKPKFKEALGKLTDKTKAIVLVNCDDAKNSGEFRSQNRDVCQEAIYPKASILCFL